MATPFGRKTVTGEYAVTWAGPAPGGLPIKGSYRILHRTLNPEAQLLPRGVDLLPTGRRFWYDQHRIAVATSGVKIESQTDAAWDAYTDAVPVRYLHGPMITVEIVARGEVPSPVDNVTVAASIEYAARSGVNALGYDNPPNIGATWTSHGGGFSEAMSAGGDERKQFVDADGAAGRSDWDVEGTRDYVRVLTTVTLSGITAWPQGGIDVTTKLFGQQRLWSKQPLLAENKVGLNTIASGHWSIPRNGVW